MIALDAIPDTPPIELLYRHRATLTASLRALWAHRGVVRSLAERDLRARYKQAFLGALWAFAQPLAMIMVFTFLARRVTHIDSSGTPYVLFSCVALLPWNFFSAAVTTAGSSLVTNTSLLSKIYCPREAFPLAGMLVAAADAAVASLTLVGLFALFQRVPSATVVWVPLLLVQQLILTLALALLLSSLMVFVRDLRNALPLGLQIALFATPVAYGMTAIPGRYQVLYSVLNPLAPIIDGYRRVLLLDQQPDWHLLGPAAVSAVVLLMVAIRLFRRLEVSFADLL
jgi:ABC-type polysaccharide/polyol phosphate export permease